MLEQNKVICKLTVKDILPSGQVDFITPNNCGVSFDQGNQKYEVGQEVYAIGYNTHCINCSCHYELVPFWSG